MKRPRTEFTTAGRDPSDHGVGGNAVGVGAARRGGESALLSAQLSAPNESCAVACV